MTKNAEKAHRSEIAGAVHEMMRDAHDAGILSHSTLRSFDVSCLAPQREVRIS